MRNLRSRTFITAGIAVDAPDMPNRAAIPNGPPGIWVSSRTLRRGDTYTVDVYTPKPTERELRAAGSVYDRNLDGFRTIELAEPPGRSSGTPPGTPATIVRFPQWDERGVPPDAFRPGVRDGGAEAPRPRPRTRALRPVAHVGARRSGSSAAPATRSTTSSRSRPTSAAASPTPSRRPRSRARSRASCSTPSPATASSTRARWRCCCGWAASPRAWAPASPRAPTTARPRSTWCATSTPTPGSRRGSRSTAG